MGTPLGWGGADPLATGYSPLVITPNFVTLKSNHLGIHRGSQKSGGRTPPARGAGSPRRPIDSASTL